MKIRIEKKILLETVVFTWFSKKKRAANEFIIINSDRQCDKKNTIEFIGYGSDQFPPHSLPLARVDVHVVFSSI